MTRPETARRAGTLGRIRALMAKTRENGCTEAEAAEAARKVDELMALYEIDLDEVAMRQQEIIPVTVPKAAQHAVQYAARAIARFTDCNAWLRGKIDIIYLGFQVDTEIAEYLTLLFKRAIDREGATYILFNPAWEQASKAEKTELLRSFGIGMGVRLGERLSALKSKRDFTQQQSTGRNLVMMKKPAVDAAMAALGILLGNAGRQSAPRNRVAFNAGQSAAQNVSINQGVAGRAARQGGRLV
ncbi:DUF7168 domain-containing protein [Rhodopila sp.]|uniref:DUF7168 domain-containing protein n=1 Tax=Rhodopila sp. TaxID=2480087 RepID=UPI003D097A4C